MLIELTGKQDLLSNNRFKPELGAALLQHQQTNKLKGDTRLKQAKLSRLQLLLELDAVRESERQRLARELHDQMGQDLTALTLGLRSLKKELGIKPEVIAQFEQLQVIVFQINQQVHDIAWELRPLILDDLGLQEALLSLFEKWSLNTGIKVNFQCAGLNEQELPKSLEAGIYRVIQEALTNVSKHAAARNVVIDFVCCTGRLVISIADDGQGFDTSPMISGIRANKCFGLLGMQERVELFSGTFNIVSAPNSGTTVSMSIPLYSQKKR